MNIVEKYPIVLEYNSHTVSVYRKRILMKIIIVNYDHYILK